MNVSPWAVEAPTEDAHRHRHRRTRSRSGAGALSPVFPSGCSFAVWNLAEATLPLLPHAIHAVRARARSATWLSLLCGSLLRAKAWLAMNKANGRTSGVRQVPPFSAPGERPLLLDLRAFVHRPRLHISDEDPLSCSESRGSVGMCVWVALSCCGCHASSCGATCPTYCKWCSKAYYLNVTVRIRDDIRQCCSKVCRLRPRLQPLPLDAENAPKIGPERPEISSKCAFQCSPRHEGAQGQALPQRATHGNMLFKLLTSAREQEHQAFALYREMLNSGGRHGTNAEVLQRSRLTEIRRHPRGPRAARPTRLVLVRRLVSCVACGSCAPSSCGLSQMRSNQSTPAARTQGSFHLLLRLPNFCRLQLPSRFPATVRKVDLPPRQSRKSPRWRRDACPKQRPARPDMPCSAVPFKPAFLGWAA